MAKGDFTVDVPITIKGGTASSGGSSGGATADTGTKELKKLNKGVKELNKTMFMNIDVIEIITSFFGDLIRLFQPLIRILSILFLIIFLPLLPLLIILTKGLAKLVGLFVGEDSIWKFIAKTIIGGLLIILGGILLAVSGPFLAIVAGIGLLIAGIFLLGDAVKMLIGWVVKAGAWLWNKILSAFEFLKEISPIIMEKIITAWEFMQDIPNKIWENILKPAFSFLSDVGLRIWGVIKAGLGSIKSLGKMIWDFIKSSLRGLGGLIGRADGGGVASNQPYMVGERGPELFVPNNSGNIIPNGGLGGVNITINNPSFRGDEDMRRFVDMVGRKLQSQGNRRFSV